MNKEVFSKNQTSTNAGTNDTGVFSPGRFPETSKAISNNFRDTFFSDLETKRKS